MAVHSKNLANPDGMLFRLTGDVSAEDLLGISSKVAVQDRATYVLVDFSSASFSTVTVADLHQITVNERSLPDSLGLEKLAIVGIQDKDSWLKENYLLFAETWVGRHIDFETRFCQSLEEAARWLGIDPGSIDTDQC